MKLNIKTGNRITLGQIVTFSVCLPSSVPTTNFYQTTNLRDGVSQHHPWLRQGKPHRRTPYHQAHPNSKPSNHNRHLPHPPPVNNHRFTTRSPNPRVHHRTPGFPFRVNTIRMFRYSAPRLMLHLHILSQNQPPKRSPTHLLPFSSTRSQRTRQSLQIALFPHRLGFTRLR